MWRPERWRPKPDEAQPGQLDALDRALAGGSAGKLGAHAELTGLVRAVRDDRRPLRPAFAAELDRRVAAGFPRRPAGPPEGASARRRRPEPHQWLGGLGLTAALVVAVIMVAGRGAPTSPQSSDSARGVQTLRAPAGESGTSSAPAPTAGPAGGAGSPAAAAGAAGGGVAAAHGAPTLAIPAPAPPSAAAPGARAVARDAALGLLAPRGHVQQVADRAIAATDRLGGVVESSNVTLDDRGGSQANLELQVPGAELDRALAVLSTLAHVSSRTQNGLDITDPTGAARDRLAESRAERDALLRQLAQASNANQVASIHARLGLIDGRIAQDRAQLQALVGRAAFARLSVTIAEDPAPAGNAGWGPAAALDDAVTVLEAVFSVLVIALAGLLPAAAVGGLAWWAAGPLRRRRREAALAGGS